MSKVYFDTYIMLYKGVYSYDTISRTYKTVYKDFEKG